MPPATVEHIVQWGAIGLCALGLYWVVRPMMEDFLKNQRELIKQHQIALESIIQQNHKDSMEMKKEMLLHFEEMQEQTSRSLAATNEAVTSLVREHQNFINLFSLFIKKEVTK